jgi:hypothetical protein
MSGDWVRGFTFGCWVRWWRWIGSASAALVAVLVFAAPAGAFPATTATTAFTNAGQYVFTVPFGVTSIEVTAVGAAGDDSSGNDAGGEGASAGGLDASVPAHVTVPVSSGEQLYVSVGGVGVIGNSGGGGAGGFGGGGGGGVNAGGGGGASVVTAGSPFPWSALVVAAGGGGAGYKSSGGDAGSLGATCGGCGGPGGPGSQSSGGSGGLPAGSGTVGGDGQFGAGGAGGESAGTFAYYGGGGGGGGYYGGGGGGGGGGSNVSDINVAGGGGGGGSSFVTPLATNVAGSPAATDAPAEVDITYSIANAGESTDSIVFGGTVPLGVASTEQPLMVTNSGAAPLIISGVSLGGTDPADYLVNLGTCEEIDPSSSCTVEVRFAPQQQGASSATLKLLTNAATPPATVDLSGTGGTLPTGPTGATGLTGTNGTNGTQGPPGKPGAAGKVELISCKTVTKKVKGHSKKVQKCTGKLISGTVKFTTSAAADQATLSRAGVVYARGESIDVGGGTELVLSRRRALRPGAYTLTLRTRDRGHWITRKERVAIG